MDDLEETQEIKIRRIMELVPTWTFEERNRKLVISSSGTSIKQQTQSERFFTRMCQINLHYAYHM